MMNKPMLGVAEVQELGTFRKSNDPDGSFAIMRMIRDRNTGLFQGVLIVFSKETPDGIVRNAVEGPNPWTTMCGLFLARDAWDRGPNVLPRAV